MSDPTSDDAQRGDAPASNPVVERSELLRKGLKSYLDKLARKLSALNTDLDEAGRGPQYRRFGETLLAYAHLVPARDVDAMASAVVALLNDAPQRALEAAANRQHAVAQLGFEPVAARMQAIYSAVLAP